MSSLLEIVGADPLVQDANNNSGFNILANPNEDAYINIKEIEGTESQENPGQDIVVTGNGFDVVFAGEGDDIVVGGNNNDLLDGGAGSDILRGGAADDIIIGGEGSDILAGGSGKDIFRFQLSDFANGEVDSIMDFEQGVDRIQINGVDPDLVTIEDDLIKYNGETIISIGGDVTGGTDEDTFELF